MITVTTGAAGSDINQATKTCKSDGNEVWNEQRNGSSRIWRKSRRSFFRKISNSNNKIMSEEVAQKIDKEIRKLVDEGYE